MDKELLLSKLNTVQLVPPTPLTPDGKAVVPAALEELIQQLGAAGIRVFLPAAGTGEFHSLSVDEVVQCVHSTRRAAPRDAIVIAPVGFSVEYAVAVGRRSLAAGADALLLMPPVHPYLSDGGFRDYFLAIAGELRAPMLAYKRGPVPSDRLLCELGETDQLAGVKYAVNDLLAFSRFVGASGGRLGLYCGTAERWAPYFMISGATGYTSGVGSVAPRVTLALHQALATGDDEQARKWLAVLSPLEDYRAQDSDSYNIAAVKYAVSLRGRDFGPCRPPQRRLTSDEQAQIRRLVEPIQHAERGLESHPNGHR